MIRGSYSLTRSLPLPVLTRSKRGVGLLRQSTFLWLILSALLRGDYFFFALVVALPLDPARFFAAFFFVAAFLEADFFAPFFGSLGLGVIVLIGTADFGGSQGVRMVQIIASASGKFVGSASRVGFDRSGLRGKWLRTPTDSAILRRNKIPTD